MKALLGGGNTVVDDCRNVRLRQNRKLAEIADIEVAVGNNGLLSSL